MNFTVTMKLNPGDQTISKAAIRMYDANGHEVGQQLLLEAETAETQLELPVGGRMEVTEAERPVMSDPEQKATIPVDLTEGQLRDKGDGKPGPGSPKGDKSDEKGREAKEREEREAQARQAEGKNYAPDKDRQAHQTPDAGGKTGYSSAAPPKGEKSDNAALTPPPVKKT